MELNKGYKKTEIGIIPEDWILMSIDQIFEFYSTSNYSKAQMLTDGEVGCFHYGLIHSLPNSNYDIAKGVKYYVTRNQAKYEFIKDGDVVMVDASEDLSGVNKSIEISGVKDNLYIAGLHTFLLRDKGFYQTNFRGAILNSYHTKAQFYRLAVGMKVYGVSKQQLKTVILPIPTKPEQTAIAKALSEADELINSLKKLIKKKLEIKDGVIQELLKPKDGWVVKKVQDIAVVGRGRVISHKEIALSIQKSYPVYSSQTTNDGIMGFLDTYDFDGEYVTWTTDGENAGTVFYRNGKFNCTNVCGTIKLKSDNAFFISKVLNSVTSFHVSRNLANPKLMNDPMKKIEISIPDINEQDRISKVILELELDLIALENKLKKYINIKNGMLQNLLTGKIRLI